MKKHARKHRAVAFFGIVTGLLILYLGIAAWWPTTVLDVGVKALGPPDLAEGIVPVRVELRNLSKRPIYFGGMGGRLLCIDLLINGKRAQLQEYALIIGRPCWAALAPGEMLTEELHLVVDPSDLPPDFRNGLSYTVEVYYSCLRPDESWDQQLVPVTSSSLNDDGEFFLTRLLRRAINGRSDRMEELVNGHGKVTMSGVLKFPTD